MAAKLADSPATTTTSEPDLVMTRVFDAPRTLVFAAWTQNEHLQKWQGAPEGYTVSVHESDIRPGGRFDITMHGQDGRDHRVSGVYREVVSPERLVYTHVWADASGKPGKETLVTITFSERGDKTELVLRQVGLPSEGARAGHERGWASTFDNLAKYLVTQR